MSSESEDFESADEGVQVDSPVRRLKKNRLPSSNDEDSGQETDTAYDSIRQYNDRIAAKRCPDAEKPSEGWDDFEIGKKQLAVAIEPAAAPFLSGAGPSGILPKPNDKIVDEPFKDLPIDNRVSKQEASSKDCEEKPNLDEKVKDESSEDQPIDNRAIKQEASPKNFDENPKPLTGKKAESTATKLPIEKMEIREKPEAEEETRDDGWGNFDEDWGEESSAVGFTDAPPLNRPTIMQAGNQDIEPLSSSDNIVKLENASDKSDPSAPSNDGWGWDSWGVNSLLSSATAGITSITSHVSQVIESGIGAPDPEELAKLKPQEDAIPSTPAFCPSPADKPHSTESVQNREEGFPFGNLISGVSHITKFVENTGTKVLSGGLDTLETIGKKTMEVLQDGDPGLAKKKALLGLDADKPVLSAVLREARDRADEEDRAQEKKREAKQVHYEALFDDFGGLVHLEALEMLSKQFQMQIESKLMQLEGQKLQDLKETLQQVAELCELPSSDDEEECVDLLDPATLRTKLEETTQDMGIGQQLNFDAVVSNLEECLEWLSSTTPGGCRSVFARGVQALARGTAGALQVYHKAAELLSVKTRRSTPDEADSLTQMTALLMRYMSELATRFTQELNKSGKEGDQSSVNEYTTNIFLEAGNSSRYIQNAFQLTLPVLQVGAI